MEPYGPPKEHVHLAQPGLSHMPAQVLRDYHTYSEQRLRSVGDAAVERGQQTFSETVRSLMAIDRATMCT